MDNNFVVLLSNLIKSSLEKNIVISSDIKEMSHRDIVCIENKFDVNLPSIYKDFLSVCGNGGGQLIDNSLLHYPPSLLHLYEGVQEMIDEDIENVYEPIPNNAFFFASKLGAHYWYFICDENPDPIVYYITAGDETHSKCGKLSISIIQTLSNSMDTLQKNRE
jgi:SMI1 / KNR4 family (SUKH-1)